MKDLFIVKYLKRELFAIHKLTNDIYSVYDMMSFDTWVDEHNVALSRNDVDDMITKFGIDATAMKFMDDIVVEHQKPLYIVIRKELEKLNLNSEW